MDQFPIYLILFGIIVIIGQVFRKSLTPITLILVMTGMLLSFFPSFPQVVLNPNLVLNVFLPMLVYQISTSTSWVDIKKYRRPIALLSVGHVVFITCLVAWVIHTLIPELGWPLAFVLGAVVSPPDDVAIVTIAEKIRMPRVILTILEGEGLLNDATALIIFRFALAALITHEFMAIQAFTSFVTIVCCETAYGLLVGYLLGELRVRISNSALHLIASLLTPFIAYIPAEMLGGSGILATVVTGFVIGNRYAVHYTPEFRLVSFAVWPALGFAIQNLLFLLVGLDMKNILYNISSIPFQSIALYSAAIIATVILGRFFWVYGCIYFLPRFLFPSIRKKDPLPPWQFPFITSWAGMRGSISLAAALAIPALPMLSNGANPQDLVVFLVFVIIAATFLLQGLTLPWLLKVLDVSKYGKEEEYSEHLSELEARMLMINAALRWLLEYRKQIVDSPKLLDEVKLYISEYLRLKRNLASGIKSHMENVAHDEKSEMRVEEFLLSQIVEVERSELMRLWKNQKININIRNKLITRLDHHSRNLQG
jgi:Na+/H+ antiporter